MSQNILGEALRQACGPLKDLSGKLSGEDGLWWLEALKKFLRKENPFSANENPEDFQELKRKWSRIYKKYFRIKPDFSELRIPKKPDGDWWLIIVAMGMTSERIFQVSKKNFGVWKWTNENLDEIVKSDRSAKNGAYAVWVKANIEADEEFKNLSANDLLKQNHVGITLEERMLLEVFYFAENGKHLDIASWTLCTGSRCSVGNVPSVFWYSNGREMCVGWCFPDNRNGRLRSRQVVSV
jgi:hypothetical protein